jgi:hypothetical protein
VKIKGNLDDIVKFADYNRVNLSKPNETIQQFYTNATISMKAENPDPSRNKKGINEEIQRRDTIKKG